MAEAGAGFDSKGIGLRAQKKILGKMSSKRTAKIFIDELTGEVLDSVYRLAKEYTNSKKEAEKVMKNMIKIVVKIGILFRNDQFNKEELVVAEKFRKKFRLTIMSLISFYEVDFTFDKNYLMKSLNECRSLLISLISRHLTEKSQGRINHVFDFFTNSEMLEQFFEAGGPLAHQAQKIIQGLNRLVDEEKI